MLVYSNSADIDADIYTNAYANIFAVFGSNCLGWWLG